MNLQLKKYRDVTVIFISGTIDTASAPALQQSLQALLEQGHTRLVLDLEKVKYVGSAGVRVIIAILQAVRQQGGDLRLSGASTTVDSVLALTGLNLIMHVYPNFLAAIAGYREAPVVHDHQTVKI